ncbi:hypothetical protein ACVI1L_005178 [Bradyrhizobium sp. USDA 4516]
MSAIPCLLPFGTSVPDCLDSPVYEPDEEHATADVLNAKERMDPAVNAGRERGCGDACALLMQGVGND